MEAYLSAASLQLNRQLFGLDSPQGSIGFEDGTLNLNQLSADLLKPSTSFDLFKMVDVDAMSPSPDFAYTDSRVALDLIKSESLSGDFYDPRLNIPQCQESSNSLGETESESYTKIEQDLPLTKKSAKKGKKKVDKSDINQTIQEERRRLVKKLNSCAMDRIVYNRRVKNNKKDPKISADNYRGSRFWGVSKNKSKWQVMITLNHYKEYKGGFDTEEQAARMYDKKSICTFGLKAKTNFSYTRAEVELILREDESIIM